MQILHSQLTTWLPASAALHSFIVPDNPFDAIRILAFRALTTLGSLCFCTLSIVQETNNGCGVQDQLIDSTIDESLLWYGDNAWLESFADSLHGSGKSSSTTAANNLF